MSSVTPIRSISPVEMPEAAGATAKPGEFRNLMENVIGKVEQVRSEASQAVEGFLTGEGGELHTVALATQRAELALQMFLQTRNKVVQAYQEIMRMQL
jgi:flagellar hook-basal body complex protein FliE